MRMSRTRQIIASVLVLSYGLVAVGGHGLHALLPCGDPDCCVAEASTHTCSCGLCDHSEPQPAAGETDSKGPAFGGPKSGHDAKTCVVCALLAKVKLGGPTGPMVLELCHHSTAEKCLHTSTVPATFLLIRAPRGPPMSELLV